MSVFQVTLFMRFEKWGWTEQWTTTREFEDPALITLNPAYRIAWSSLHHNFCVLEGYEVRNLDKPRLAIPRSINSTGLAGGTPAFPSFAIKVLMRGPEGANRFLTIRGLPAGWLNIDSETGQPALPGIAISAVNSYVQEMVNSLASIRQLDSTEVNPESFVVQVRRSSFVVGYTEILATPGLPALAGDTIKITRMDTCQIAGLNGDWKVMAVNGTYLVLPRPWKLPDDTVIEPDDARARMVSYTQRSITGWEIHSVGSRDTGRPSRLSRGRSRGVSCRL